MGDYKIFAALSYFSVFFAGFIFPLAVYIIVKDDEVKKHALRALISHIIPVFTITLIFVGIFSGSAFHFLGSVLIFFIINLVLIIWNVVQGIKVLL